MKKQLCSFLLIGAILFMTSCSKDASSVKDTSSVEVTKSVDVVKEAIDDSDDFYIYVSSDDCRDCVEFYPKLMHYAAKYNMEILQFDVTEHRKNKDDEYRGFIEEMDIKNLPTILIIKNGKISNIFTSADVESELKEHFGS